MNLQKKIIFICEKLFPQQIITSGKVTDTLQNPLAYANILAIPDNDNEAVTFAITKKNTNNLYKPKFYGKTTT